MSAAHKDGKDWDVDPNLDGVEIPSWMPIVDPFTDHPAPQFPLETLPEAIQKVCRRKSEESGFDVGGYAFGFLIAASNVIDSRIHINVGPFKTRGYLWGGLIGASGDGKTPILSAALHSFRAINVRVVQESNREMARWVDACDLLKKGDPKPPKPPFLQKICNDTTVEGLARVLADNPDGVLLDVDELTEFMGRMDAYSGAGGKDRGVYLRAFDGGPNIINRASNVTPIVIENFAVGILTGVQPDRLAEIFNKSGGGTSDGLFQRFLVYQLAPSKDVVYRARDDSAGFFDAHVQVLWEDLLSIDPQKTFHLSSDAMAAMCEYHNDIRKIGKRTVGARFSEHLNKFPGFIARIALTLHCLEYARTGDIPHEISLVTLKKALKIIRVLLRHSESAYLNLDKAGGASVTLMKSACEAILSKKWGSDPDGFQRGDLTRDATYWRDSDRPVTEAALDLLIELGWITDITSETKRAGRGRKSDGRFLTNPEVLVQFKDQAQRIAEERQARFELIQKCAAARSGE